MNTSGSLPGDILEALASGCRPDREGYLKLIRSADSLSEQAAAYATEVRDRVYGRRIFIRGLIEFTNYCSNDCYYCGLRAHNTSASRYRLSRDEILDCAAQGYELGFRTFVLQGGEDPFFTDEILTDIIRSLKSAYPDCAVTLSAGERGRDSYAALKAAGADRYLLRHEGFSSLVT